jgi:hypothetical protein
MKRGLRFLSVCSKLWVTVGLIVTLTASNHDAFAGTVKGQEAGTFVPSNFSYNGNGDAGLTTYEGKDNIGGHFTGQDLEQYSFTGSSCTAPDGSAGSVFVLVQATGVNTYKQGQLYLAGAGAADGSVCASNSTGATQAILTFSVTGGTGQFTNATGSITLTIRAQVLAFSPSNSGIFGARQATIAGSVTY